jgi:tripartite-type tricarboxylate transporter receptor subunit TctC
VARRIRPHASSPNIWRPGSASRSSSTTIPGAGGTIGTQSPQRAPADGYTLLMGSNTEIVINPNLYRKLSYDTLKDFTPISLVANTPLILIVHPSLPAKNVAS